mmetsp:Transcript_105760/g.264825  ORF Transcript_105760/g.264825 Transcript_105760/m.264825 type:complete len:91 (+) Transcript_105760:992-1264(+)
MHGLHSSALPSAFWLLLSGSYRGSAAALQVTGLAWLRYQQSHLSSTGCCMCKPAIIDRLRCLGPSSCFQQLCSQAGEDSTRALRVTNFIR